MARDSLQTNLTCTVYGLHRSDDPRIRYIGQTFYSLGNRLKRHLAEARNGNQTFRSQWIRKAWLQGASIVAVPLCVDAEWNTTERELIAEYRRRGCALLNCTDGGQGAAPGVSKSLETRLRMSRASKAKWADPAMRQKMLDGSRAFHADDSYRAKVSVVQKDIWAKPETRKKLLAAIKPTHSSSSRNANLSAAAKKQNACPKMRKRNAEANRRFRQDPAVREAIAERTRKQWANPETRELMCRRLREAGKKRSARKKSPADPS